MKFGSSFYNLRKKGVSALFEEIQNIFQFEASWQIAPKRLLLKTLVVNSKNLDTKGNNSETFSNLKTPPSLDYY